MLYYINCRRGSIDNLENSSTRSSNSAPSTPEDNINVVVR